MSEKRFCSQCGNELKENAKFCNYCGATVPEGTNVKKQPEEKDGGWTKKQKQLLLIIVIIVAVAVAIIVGVLVGLNHNRDISALQEDDFAEGNLAEEVDEETTGIEEPDVTSALGSTPEEFMAYVYDTYFIPEIDAESFWDECVSDASKGSDVVEADYIYAITHDVNENGLVCLSYTAENTESMDEDSYKITGSLTYMMSDTEQTIDIVDYVTIENGKYKVIPQDLTRTESLIPTQRNGVLKISACEVEYFGDGSINLSCTIENTSSSNVQFGWVSPSQFELELKDGKKLTTDLQNGTQIHAGQTLTLDLSFEDVSADIQKITIYSVNVLTSQGLPSDFSGGSTVTASFD